MENTVFNLVMRETEPDGSPIRDVIRKIRKPDLLRAAEEAWREAQGRHEELTAQLREALAQARQNGVGPSGVEARKLTALNAQVMAASDQVRDALTAVLEQRQPYVDACQAAVAPLRRIAAGEALAAADKLRIHLAEQDQVDAELCAVGGSPLWRTGWREALMVITGPLRRVANGGGHAN